MKGILNLQKLLFIFISFHFHHLLAWRQWNYSISSTTSSEVWMTQWSKASGEDIKKIPRPRRGHSLVLAGDYLVMFGGRGNEAELVHIPRTYNVEKVEISSTHSSSHLIFRKMVGLYLQHMKINQSYLVKMLYLERTIPIRMMKI